MAWTDIRICLLGTDIRICVAGTDIRIFLLGTDIRICLLWTDIRICLAGTDIKVCVAGTDIRVCPVAGTAEPAAEPEQARPVRTLRTRNRATPQPPSEEKKDESEGQAVAVMETATDDAEVVPDAEAVPVTAGRVTRNR